LKLLLEIEPDHMSKEKQVWMGSGAYYKLLNQIFEKLVLSDSDVFTVEIEKFLRDRVKRIKERPIVESRNSQEVLYFPLPLFNDVLG